MARTCAHPFCDEPLPDDADRRKRYHDDNTCGRDARRIRRNKGRSRDLARAERFWQLIRVARPQRRGWTGGRGTSRPTPPQTPTEVVA